MSKARHLLKRIQSIKSTKKTTYAMKLVAGAKLKKMQDLTINSRAYEKALLNILLRIFVESYSSYLFEKREGLLILLVIIGSSRGLCGGFNMNIKKYVEKKYDVNKVECLVLGKKIAEILNFWGKVNIKQTIPMLPDIPDINYAQDVAKLIKEFYKEGKYSSVEIVYTDFLSVLSPKPNSKLLLPLKLEIEARKEEDVKETFLFEPDVKSVLDYIIPRIVETKLLQALLESKCSEHASRMIAMENATKNAGDLAEALSLLSNKIRQASITSEILDVIGGASVVKEGVN